MMDIPIENQDRVFIARAIQLARKGLYTSKQNPRVGCVIVKAGKIIGEGWHRGAGLAHAEIEALNNIDVGESAEGADVYVSLEPCCHQGKTGPCTDALIKAKVKRVICAMQDPAPHAAGKGFSVLKKAGIEVQTGLLAEQAARLNPGFIKRMSTNMPYVRIKMAMSIDGRTAAKDGNSQWISGAAARIDVQQWRAQSDAIITGIATVLTDDPLMTVRPDENWSLLWPQDIPLKQPLRCVLDSHLRFPLNAKMREHDGKIILFTLPEAQQKADGLKAQGVHVMSVPAANNGRPDLTKVLQKLAELEVNEVWVEAGSQLAGAFISENLFDEIIIYMSPVLLGSQAKPLFDLPEIKTMQDKMNLNMVDMCKVGDDLRLTFRKQV
jgi:diaminohydroxyphosphoribosylaminopyrimidine deaminase / 5-amino-6-(5-phosphoribosylamino)uracil reductase